MGTFSYRAKRGPNDTATGVIEADNLDDAVEKLSAQGLIPVHLQEEAKGTVHESKKAASQKPAEPREKKTATIALSKTKIKIAPPPLFDRVKSSDITIFGRQLASLTKAGVPILQALWIIYEQSQKPKFKKVIFEIHDEIKNGKSFSDCLKHYPKYFPPVYVALVRAGEDSGSLESSLLRISEHRQKQEAILSHVRTAMAYPALMFLTGVGTIVFMLTYVIPKLTSLFSTMGGHLPLPTRILMRLSHFFQNPIFWIIVGSVIVGIVTAIKLKPLAAQSLWSRFALRAPILKDFMLKSELARFSRTLELLIKSGVSILRAIEITAPVLNNLVLRQEIEKTGRELAGGGSLGQSMKDSGVFPLFMTNLISVGEQSGRMDEALSEIAGFYEHETDESIKIMTSLLEPIMIVVMGAVVGFIVIAMLLPMFELNMMVK